MDDLVQLVYDIKLEFDVFVKHLNMKNPPDDSSASGDDDVICFRCAKWTYDAYRSYNYAKYRVKSMLYSLLSYEKPIHGSSLSVNDTNISIDADLVINDDSYRFQLQSTYTNTELMQHIQLTLFNDLLVPYGIKTIVWHDYEFKTRIWIYKNCEYL